MMARISMSLVTTLVVFAGAGGCARSAHTDIHNPLQAGNVEENVVTIPGSIEQQNGLPKGSLADQASILRADAEAICIGVLLRGIQDHHWTDLDQWDIALDTGDSKLPPGDVQVGRTDVTAVQGTGIEYVKTGRNLHTCSDEDSETHVCRQWVDEPETVGQSVPQTFNIEMGRSQICFANGGKVTAKTKSITLGFRRKGVAAMDRGPANKMDFEWRFK
jgi:hypothetical protein